MQLSFFKINIIKCRVSLFNYKSLYFYLLSNVLRSVSIVNIMNIPTCYSKMIKKSFLQFECHNILVYQYKCNLET